MKGSLGENIDYSAMSGIHTEACPWNAMDAQRGNKAPGSGFLATASLLSSIFHCQCLLHILYPPPYVSTRYKGKVHPQKNEVRYLGLGHPKDCDKFYFYVVLLRKMLLKYKVDMTHDYTAVC